MTTLELIALISGGAFVLFILGNICYSIGLQHGIQYMVKVINRKDEDEDTEGER